MVQRRHTHRADTDGIYATAGRAGAQTAAAVIRFHGVLAPNAKLRSGVVPTPPQQTTQGEGDCEHAHSKPLRMTWARLVKRVFEFDIEQRKCGGKLKLIAVIEEPDVIEKILKHIGLHPQPPPRERARRVDLFEAVEVA
jgi:hypothetical protein